jgi:serine/threonine protein kinase
MAKKITTGDLYAIKILNREDVVRKNMVGQVLAERQVMSLSKTPYVVRLFYAFESQECLYLVMEYMIGGDLSTLLQAHGVLSEAWVRIYMSEAITALDYLHSNGIIHRDIKPDNMLIDEGGHLKLTDFGLSSIMLPENANAEKASGDASPPSEHTKHHRKRSSGNYFHPESPVQPRPLLGTPDYLAPELLLGVKHGPAVDWWALGICMYEFLYGMPPFTAESPEAIFRRIQTLGTSYSYSCT